MKVILGSVEIILTENMKANVELWSLGLVWVVLLQKCNCLSRGLENICFRVAHVTGRPLIKLCYIQKRAETEVWTAVGVVKEEKSALVETSQAALLTSAFKVLTE